MAVKSNFDIAEVLSPLRDVDKWIAKNTNVVPQ